MCYIVRLHYFKRNVIIEIYKLMECCEYECVNKHESGIVKFISIIFLMLICNIVPKHDYWEYCACKKLHDTGIKQM
jgi:hypothetical protein